MDRPRTGKRAILATCHCPAAPYTTGHSRRRNNKKTSFQKVRTPSPRSDLSPIPDRSRKISPPPLFVRILPSCQIKTFITIHYKDNTPRLPSSVNIQTHSRAHLPETGRFLPVRQKFLSSNAEFSENNSPRKQKYICKMVEIYRCFHC